MNYIFDAAFAAFLNLRKNEGITRKHAIIPSPRRNRDNGMTRIYVMDSVYGRDLMHYTSNFAIISKKDMDHI